MKVVLTISDINGNVRVDMSPSFLTLRDRFKLTGPEGLSPAEVYAMLMLKKAREASQTVKEAKDWGLLL